MALLLALGKSTFTLFNLEISTEKDKLPTYYLAPLVAAPRKSRSIRRTLQNVKTGETRELTFYYSDTSRKVMEKELKMLDGNIYENWRFV